MNLLFFNLIGNPSGFQDKNPGTCCPPLNSPLAVDLYVETAEIVLNTTPDPDEWELHLTLNDGSTIITTTFPAAFTATDVTVSAFDRHPDALTDINFKHTIRITLSNGTTFDLNLLPLLGFTANTLFVTANGDDTHAAATDGGHNQHAPWANPTIAMAAATAGDTIVVYPGEYNIGDPNAIGSFTLSGTNGQIDNVGLTVGGFPWSLNTAVVPFNTSIGQTALDLINDINATAAFPGINATIISNIGGLVTIQITGPNAMVGGVFSYNVSGLPGDMTFSTLSNMVSAPGGIIDDGNQQLVRNGVTLYLMPGSHINYTNLIGTASTPFDDGGQPGVFKIRGSGNITFNRDISVSDSFVVASNPETIVDWEFDELVIRRRFFASNFASWRFKGILWNNRESMLYAFRFPNNNTTVRSLDLTLEKVKINADNTNNQWTRQELRNFNEGVANINYNEVTYPHGYPAGGFHQTTSTDTLHGVNALINININKITREGLITNIADYLIRTFADASGGQTNILNISTHTGIEAQSGIVGVQTTKRTSRFEGKILDGYTGSTIYLMVFTGSLVDHQVNLLIDCYAQSVNFLGIYGSRSTNTTFSGRIKWSHTANSPLLVDALNQPLLKDLTLSGLAVPSLLNSVAPTVANIRVQNCYATTSVGPAINQLIETFLVDLNV